MYLYPSVIRVKLVDAKARVHTKSSISYRIACYDFISRELIPETREAYWKERSVISKEDDDLALYM